MSKPFSVRFTSAFIILFSCSVVPAFAQRGGGGHAGGGGGAHGGGGGGFHGGGGGGMRSNPGPGYSRGPAGNPSAPGAPASAPMRSGNQLGSRPSFASAPRPNAGPAAQPNSGFARPGQQFGNSSAPAAVADGRWHSFGGSVAGQQAQGAAASSAANAPSNFHVFTSNRSMGSAGPSRSFSGQGGEVWENAPAARNVVPRSQSLSTLQGSFRGSDSARTALRPNSTLSASSTISGASGLKPGQQFSNRPMAAASFQQLRGFNRTGWPFGRFGRGCWNCGFGVGGWGWGGFGFGWGWPGFGFWGWDPLWVDPWWGSPAVGYGYYAPPAYNIYSAPNAPYPDAANSAPNDYSNSPSTQDSQENPAEGDNSSINGNWVTPNGPAVSSTPSSPTLAVPFLIYLKSGAVVSVRDYWMLDGQLHYILMNGRQNSVGLEQVDLPRTNTENAKSGVKFIFKSEPSVTAPPEPAPIQQQDAPSAPEAHT